MQDFNFHTHTYRCKHADQDYLDEEYVIDFIKAGYKQIAFTDHCPEKNKIDTRKKMRMEYSQKDEYLNSIKILKEKYKDRIEIFSGFEIEYLPGEEENLKELKDETDILILGQHFVYDKSKQNLVIIGKQDFNDDDLIRYSEYIEKAAELKIPNIIAHPDFYMQRRKTFGKIEEEIANRICRAAEKYNIVLEININGVYKHTYFENKIENNDPYEKQKERLINVEYPCKAFWNIAKNYDIKVLYGIDAHYKDQIKNSRKTMELTNELLGKEIIDNLNFVKEFDINEKIFK